MLFGKSDDLCIFFFKSIFQKEKSWTFWYFAVNENKKTTNFVKWKKIGSEKGIFNLNASNLLQLFSVVTAKLFVLPISYLNAW